MKTVYYQLRKWGSVGVLLLLGVGLLAMPAVPKLYRGEARKEGSGISQMGQLHIETEPAATGFGFEIERLWSEYDDWEPTVAVDPNSGYLYQMTTRYDGPKPCPACPMPALIFRRSEDGGASWQPDQFIGATIRSQHDPQLQVDNTGVIHAAWLNNYVPGIKYMNSSDYGQSWSEPVVITPIGTYPGWSDKPILAISPNGQDVYIAFNAGASFVIASHDGGQTFAAPVQTSNPIRYWFHSAGAVAPNGDVYFGATSYRQDYTGNVQIHVLRSIDEGLSWTTKIIDISRETPPCDWADGCYLGFLGATIGLAVDSAGTVLIAYNANSTPAAPQQLYVRTSPDGVNWSSRQQLSVNDSAVYNLFPAVAAGPQAGDFRLVWQDDRQLSQTGWNTWFRRTTNAGTSWGPHRLLSDRSNGAPYKTENGYLFPYGDYLGIVVDSAGTNHIIWGAGNSYTGPGGSWYTRGN